MLAARSVTWEIAQLGSCRLETYPWEVAAWENTFGKLPPGKIPLGMYLTLVLSTVVYCYPVLCTIPIINYVVVQVPA